MFLQLQHDYILGNYPVGRDDAAQLSALQILVEIGFVSSPELCTLVISLLSLCCVSFFCYIVSQRTLYLVIEFCIPIFIFLCSNNFLFEKYFSSDWNSLLERFLPRQIAITRAKREWELDILSRYRSVVRYKF